MYEHTVTYYNISYFVEDKDNVTEGRSPLYGPAMPSDPDPASLAGNIRYMDEIDQMGKEGWELISVSPLLRGCYHEGAHYGYSLTAGYYLFWKRTNAKA